MYDSFLVRADSLKNDVVDGKVVGFQFAVRLANYVSKTLVRHAETPDGAIHRAFFA